MTPMVSPRLCLIISATSLALHSVGDAQVATSWIPGNGSWSDAGKWTGGIPNAVNSDIYIDNQSGTNSVVDLGITSLNFGRLRIDAGDRVETSPGIVGMAISNSSFAGAGELLLNGTFAISQSLSFDGTKTINGSGGLVLGSTVNRPEITGITNNTATIEGAANFGRPTNNSYPGTINNTGTVNANRNGAAITFYSADNSSNTGLIKATNGGTIDLNQGSMTNAGGQLMADGSGSIVRTGGFTITGGNLSGINGGEHLINGGTWRDLTVSGTARVSGISYFGGTITNNALFHVGNGAMINLVGGSSAVTFAGSGEIILNAPADTGPELIDQGNQQWTFQGLTVRGRGNVGYTNSNGAIDSVTVFNRGTFQADVDGQMLHIDVAAFDNQSGGVLRATGSGNATPGGILRLSLNGPLKNTGGTIEALNGGRIEAGAARIEGGLIRNGKPTAVPPVPGGTFGLTGITIVNPSTPHASNPFRDSDVEGMILDGDIAAENTPYNNLAPALVGEIKNTGTLRVAASGSSVSYLRLAEAAKPYVALTGGGQLMLGTLADGSPGNDSAFIAEDTSGFATKTLNNIDNTIRGFGRLGRDPNYGHYLNLENSGTISADVSGRTLGVEFNSGKNTGTFRAINGGTLNLRTTALANTGGVLEALNASPFKFIGTSQITGGTIRNVGAPDGSTNFDLGNATVVDPLVLQGPLVVRHATTLGLKGTIPNEGSVRLLNTGGSRTWLSIGTSTVSLTGGGRLILENDSMIQAGNGSSGVTLSLDDQKLSGAGWAGAEDGYARYLTVINNSSVEADQSGKQLRFTTASLTNSPGKTMKAINGGILALWSSNLINTGATIEATNSSTVQFGFDGPITGGSVKSLAGGTVKIAREFTAKGGVIFTNAGTLEFGALGGNAFNGLADGGSSIISSGTITKVGSSDYSVFSPLNNTGAIQVDSGILRWKGGGSLADSSLSAASNTDFTFQDTPFTFSGSNHFTGAGRLWFANNNVTLDDAATTVTASNFNFGSYGTSTISGPGTMNISSGGGITFHPGGPTIFSGAQLVTLAGSNSTINKSNSALDFTNGANWTNYGTISQGGYINVLNGSAGTLFKNMPGGIFRATPAQDNRFAMPFENSGEFFMDTGSLAITSSGKFVNGSAKVNAGRSLDVVGGATVTFENTGNTAIGDGFFAPTDANFSFAPGAKLTGESIGLFGASNVSGSGTLEVTKALQFGDNGGFRAASPNITLSGTFLRIAPTATASYVVRGFQAGSGGTLRLNNNSVFENAGRIDHYYTSAIASDDGTGVFRTLENSNTYFHRIDPGGFSYGDMTCSAPFDFAGLVWAQQGKTVNFTGGGLFNETAKLWPNDPASNIWFAGADKIYRARGRAVEFSGTGYVNFSNTTLQFEPSSIPGNETGISAGARVAFHGDNTIKSVTGTHGVLSSTGLVFQSGNQVVDNATLQSTGTADTSVWNATGKKLELKNGAKLVNGGRFVIQSRVGNLAGDPGIFGDATTLFHNTSTGRLIHDSNTLTEIGVDFLNEGFLEFRSGTFKFLNKFSGRGGLAVSNGAQVNLSLVGVPSDQQPAQLEILGTGSAMSIQLAAGQTLAASISSNGGQMVAAGGLNMVAAGGLNMVAAGGGNIVAAGGMNMVAAGGGNITATGAGSLINANELIGNDGSTLIGNDGSTLLARLNALISNGASASLSGAQTKMDVGATFTANNAAALIQNSAQLTTSGVIARDGASVIARDGASVIARDGAGVIARDGASVIARDGASVIARDGAGLMARGTRGLSTKAAGDAGTITAGPNGGIIGGNGIFEGAGIVQNGGRLQPGNSPGIMTWNGDLTIDGGGTLEIEIAGLTAGTQHDRVNVSGSFNLDGSLSVTMLGGFGSTVQPGDTFDIVNAGAPITTALAGTRVAAGGSYGTFEVLLVNGGTTLRLANFVKGPVNFSTWLTTHKLIGDDAAWNADPNRNGLVNLLEYALGLDPNAGGVVSGIVTGFVETGGQKYLSLSYTRPTGSDAPPDLNYIPERSTLLTSSWSSSSSDIITHSTVPGPGSLETITVRSTHPMGAGTPKEFLHLKVTLVPP